MEQPLIVITNDDGVDSPGLAALAAALDPLGELLIVAPHTQQSAMGRSTPSLENYDGRLIATEISWEDKTWPAYRVYGSPAQSVQHAMLELAPRQPALVASGINFGENIGVVVTVSGTVGAALEGAAFGIPAIAVSIQVDDTTLHWNYDDTIDFTAAIHFTRQIAERWLALEERLPDVDVLKIEIPSQATTETPWQITRLSRGVWWRAHRPQRTSMDAPAPIRYTFDPDRDLPEDTDGYAMLNGIVSVTPLSLDLTARVGATRLHDLLNHR